MDIKQKIIIRYLNGDGQRKITKELHISRNTIRKYVNEYNAKKQELLDNNILINKNEIIDDIVAEPTYDSSNRTRRKISNECIEVIKMCLIENKQKRASDKSKQQLKAIDIYELLIKKGYDISYPSISNIVRSLKDTLNEAYIKQEYSLGNICEFDWGEVKLNIDNKGFKKYQIAIFTTAFGNYRFAVLFETQDTIAFQQSHVLFFEHLGGIYNTIVYDNMKVAVARFVGHNEKQPTKGLLTLSTYYGFNFRFCNIRSGNEKGHVERSVEYVRRKAFAFKDTFSSVVLHYLCEYSIEKNNRILYNILIFIIWRYYMFTNEIIIFLSIAIIVFFIFWDKKENRQKDNGYYQSLISNLYSIPFHCLFLYLIRFSPEYYDAITPGYGHGQGLGWSLFFHLIFLGPIQIISFVLSGIAISKNRNEEENSKRKVMNYLNIINFIMPIINIIIFF